MHMQKQPTQQKHSSKLLFGRFCFSVSFEQLSDTKLSEIYVLEMQDQSRSFLVMVCVVSIRKRVLPSGLD